ncbi:uncharacterized protein LOC116304954, partial [Actinia tenebrosa]|uniref:Uncharacterized protein LOC116304954 n=1 Tax=Actinia tenebrosa TaxID=6105 RepID=A0A6P8IUA1_ACTTE
MDTITSIRNKTVRRLRTQVLDRLDADFAFTTFMEGDTDETMTEERAERIINLIPEGNYRLELTFIKYLDGEWMIEKGRNPIRASGKKDLFVLNENTRPGALVGIDMLFYEVAYPVTVVIYGAYEIKTPDVKKLKPMRHPGNCVGKLVREFFEDSSRGGKLTLKRREAIRKWEKDTNRTGGSIDNIKKLETALERRIHVKDITDGFIYSGTHKYGGRGAPIVIYQHNGHAWRELRFPRKKETKVYKNSPLAELIHENSIWLMDSEGSQFMTQDGTLYRPEIEQQRIQSACETLGEDFSDEVLSSRSLDFLAAKKRNGWKSTPEEFKDIAKA